jgi:phosphomannomutase
MNLDEKIFKAYDIRGIYPDSLDEAITYDFGKAFVEFLKAKTVVVGYDARLSSPALREALVDGVTKQGVDVIDIGLCTSPLLNFTVAKNKKYDSGIMITASHNPKQYNGFKVCRGNAASIGSENGLLEIKEIMHSQKYSSCHKAGQIKKINALDDYIPYLKKLIDFENISGLKVVVDAANGTAGQPTVAVFKNLNCELVPLYFNPNGNFPNHEPNPLKEENLTKLIEKVKKENADLGVAFDGDADRIRFIDEEGEPISCDLVTAFLTQSFLEKEKGAGIIYDLRSSWVVKEEIEKYKGRPIICRVGHTFIKEKMRQEKAIFGGEVSGHYYFRDLFYTDNADLPFLKVMEALTKLRKPLSELIAPFKKYFQTEEMNFEVSDQIALLNKLEDYYQKKHSQADISKLDGLSVELPDFWLNARPSNTEPVLRVKLEAKSKALMKKKAKELLNLVEAG